MSSPPAPVGPEPDEAGAAGAVRVPAARGRGRLRTHLFLLAAILLTFGIAGIAPAGRWEVAVLTVLMGVSLVIALRVAGARRLPRHLAEALAVAASAFSLIAALAGGVDMRASRAVACALVVLAPPALLAGVVRRITQTRSVTLEAVIEVLCVYILAGLFYTFLYSTIDHVSGTPFFAQREPATVAHCLYFSFTTLTTVGYGDLTAGTNLGHTLAVSEALLGQVYLVTIVSVIVSNLGRRR